MPLPLPVWAHYETPTLNVTTIEHYEELASSVELETQRLLREQRYDTVDNFLRFYGSFKDSGESLLDNFYRKYQPQIGLGRYTCVGLGFELISRLSSLEQRFPGIGASLHMVSCEETIGDVSSYVGGAPSVDSGEKEHVQVCLKFVINGRRGLMILDPGYHVARVITVMSDKMYPHTGWFTQSDEANCKKEYCYTFCKDDQDYVEWHSKEIRPSALERTQVALIYVARPYLTAVDVTERRNLVYNFRSLLARDAKGHLIAGIYFPISLENKPEFTIFHQTNTGKKRLKLLFDRFYPSTVMVFDREEEEIMSEAARQLGFSQETMVNLLSTLAEVIKDTSFVAQLLSINARIDSISEDN